VRVAHNIRRACLQAAAVASCSTYSHRLDRMAFQLPALEPAISIALDRAVSSSEVACLQDLAVLAVSAHGAYASEQDVCGQPGSVLRHVQRNWPYLTAASVYAICYASRRVPMGKVTAGNLVLVEGLDALISKTATVVGRHLDEEVHVFRPLRFQTRRWACLQYVTSYGIFFAVCHNMSVVRPACAWQLAGVLLIGRHVCTCCCCCCSAAAT
jgi:hypothetical protein